MTRLFALMGKFALFIAGMAVLTVMFLFISGSFLITLPVMKLSPRNRRLTAVMGAGTALVILARAYGLGKITEPVTEAPEATESRDAHDVLDSFRTWAEACNLTPAEVSALVFGTPEPERG